MILKRAIVRHEYLSSYPSASSSMVGLLGRGPRHVVSSSWLWREEELLFLSHHGNYREVFSVNAAGRSSTKSRDAKEKVKPASFIHTLLLLISPSILTVRTQCAAAAARSWWVTFHTVFRKCQSRSSVCRVSQQLVSSRKLWKQKLYLNFNDLRYYELGVFKFNRRKKLGNIFSTCLFLFLESYSFFHTCSITVKDRHHCLHKCIEVYTSGYMSTCVSVLGSICWLQYVWQRKLGSSHLIYASSKK